MFKFLEESPAGFRGFKERRPSRRVGDLERFWGTRYTLSIIPKLSL